VNVALSELARADADRSILIECADLCLSSTLPQKRLQGLSVLSEHPDSTNAHLTSFLARRLLFDADADVRTQALRTLAYHVGRTRWSWNPKNQQEGELIDYACGLCSDLTENECQRLIERVDDEWFHGPDALGERVLDLLSCCTDISLEVMERMAADSALPMQRRANALYLLFGCDEDTILENRELAEDDKLGEVYRALVENDSNS
jgi:hypothetical protein